MDAVQLAHYKEVFDCSPQPFSILYVEKEAAGTAGIKTVYANQAEAALQGEPLERIIGGSCNEIFTEADQDWLTFYTDVAESGKDRQMTHFSHKLQKMLFARCYPIDGSHIANVTSDVTADFLEESAKQDNSKYRRLFEQVQCGVTEFIVQAGDIFYLDANPAALAILGYTAREFWRKSKWQTAEIVVIEDILAAERIFNSLATVGTQTEYNYRLKRKDGAYVWVTGSLTLKEIRETGRVYQNYFVDIGRQKQAEEALLTDQKMYQSILDETDSAVIVIDAKTYEVLYGNKIACAMLENDTGPYIGSTCYQYTMGQQTPCEFCPIQHGKVQPGTHQLQLGGRIYHQEFKSIIWYGREALVEYNRDITEQTRLLYEVQTSKEKYQSVYNSLPSGVVEYIYRSGQIRYTGVNKRMLEMMGCTREELLSNRWWKVGTFSQNSVGIPFREMLDSLHTVGQTQNFEFQLKRRDGHYIWVAGSMLVQGIDEAGIHILSAVNDEDARKKAESESEAKSRFLSRMSHEIRTPINAIMGIAELEKQDIATGSISLENISGYAKETQEASQYLLALVDDILDTTRIENNTIEIQQNEVNAAEYLKAIAKLCGTMAAEKNLNFSVERKTHFRDAYIGDGVRVQQVIMNLLSNAFKFTPPGGTVKLLAEAVSETKEHTILQFTVKDTGIGISEEFQQQLFHPFTQEDNANTSPFSGSGLGLSIARELAKLMGGDISCDSEKGKGTTFVATIKVGNVHDSAEKEAAEVITNISNLDFSGIRILVCEDHPLNQKITKALLERKHCAVEIAEDGVIALDMFEKSPIGYYSMILMDIRMPNMDGLQSTREIRALARPDAASVPIVAMSANAFEEDVQKFLAAGMNEHLAKPVDAVKLYRCIAEYAHISVERAEGKPLILVVDDVEVNRVIICENLKHSYTIMTAENGRPALQLLNRHPDIVAVVTDIQMPEMDGIELVRSIRSQYRFDEVAILANTQYGDVAQEQLLLNLGADDFVYKPNEPTVLAARLKNILAKRKHILL